MKIRIPSKKKKKSFENLIYTEKGKEANKIEKHTDNNERSDNGDERNIGQGALERVSTQVLLEAVAPHTRKTRDQNAGHEHVPYGHQHRQRRHEQRRHHRHHEEHRPHDPPKPLQSPLRHNQSDGPQRMHVSIMLCTILSLSLIPRL